MIDDSVSKYFPTLKKGRKIVESAKGREEERKVPPNCPFLLSCELWTAS